MFRPSTTNARAHTLEGTSPARDADFFLQNSHLTERRRVTNVLCHNGEKRAGVDGGNATGVAEGISKLTSRPSVGVNICPTKTHRTTSDFNQHSPTQTTLHDCGWRRHITVAGGTATWQGNNNESHTDSTAACKEPDERASLYKSRGCTSQQWHLRRRRRRWKTRSTASAGCASFTSLTRSRVRRDGRSAIRGLLVPTRSGGLPVPSCTSFAKDPRRQRLSLLPPLPPLPSLPRKGLKARRALESRSIWRDPLITRFISLLDFVYPEKTKSDESFGTWWTSGKLFSRPTRRASRVRSISQLSSERTQPEPSRRRREVDELCGRSRIDPLQIGLPSLKLPDDSPANLESHGRLASRWRRHRHRVVPRVTSISKTCSGPAPVNSPRNRNTWDVPRTSLTEEACWEREREGEKCTRAGRVCTNEIC